MIADVARKLLEEYNRSLEDPKAEDVYPFIERYAKQGACEIRYRVRNKALDLVRSLCQQGYTVTPEINEDGSTTLTINWTSGG
jgi:hypothetical protein